MRPLWIIAVLLAGCAHRREVGGEDLHEALGFVEAVHPAPAMIDLEAARAAVQAEASRRDPTAEPRFEERVRGAQALAGALGDAHIVVGTPPRELQGIVPVLPVLLEGRVYVDAFVHELPRGTLLRSIEGRPAMDWLDELGALTSVDGGRAEVRRALAVRAFASLLVRHSGPRAVWSIETESPDGEVRTWTVDGLDFEGARALAEAGESPWPTWEETTDEDTVHLRLPSFGSPEVEAWSARLDAGFAELRGDETIVVDLRGNAGGNRALGVLVARKLLDRPFAQWSSVSTRVRAIPRKYRDRVDFPFGPEEALTGFPGTRVEGDPLAPTMQPVDRPHTGPVVLFVDDATNSAAIELAVALLAFHDDIKVVGTPTQGACDRHTGQLPVTFELGDGVVLMMSLFEIELVPTPGCVAGSGLPIDVPVVPTLEGWLAGEDPWWTAWAG